MGYRNYLAIIKKEELKKIDSNFIESQRDEDGYVIIDDLLKKAGMQDIYELGKYSKEGALLENIKTDIPEDLQENYKIIKEYANKNEYGFNILTKKELIYCIESFKQRVIKLLKNYLAEKSDCEFDTRTREERLISYVNDKLTWSEYYTNINEKDKFHVQSTWFYEYGIFDLIHSLKIIDWDNYCLIIYGW